MYRAVHAAAGEKIGGCLYQANRAAEKSARTMKDRTAKGRRVGSTARSASSLMLQNKIAWKKS